MPLLYDLHLSRDVRGMAKGPVRATPAISLLHDLDENGNAVTPDRDAVAQCLPAYYRKAFERAAYLSHTRGEAGFFWRLNDARGRYLNTVYAIPYVKN